MLNGNNGHVTVTIPVKNPQKELGKLVDELGKIQAREKELKEAIKGNLKSQGLTVLEGKSFVAVIETSSKKNPTLTNLTEILGSDRVKEVWDRIPFATYQSLSIKRRAE